MPRARTADPLPNRAHLLTEQRNPRTRRLHRMSVDQIARAIHREDAAVHRALRDALPALSRFLRAAERRFIADAPPNAPGRLIYVGAGTSGRLGVLDASEAPPTFHVEHGRVVGLIAGGDAALRRSSEGKEDDPDGAEPELRALKLDRRDTVLGIAAGGTTPYVLGALAAARRLAPECLTGLMACTPVRKPRGVEHLIVLATGPEVVTGSTRMKAGTATKMALNLISTTLMVRAGRVYENLMVDARATNLKLRDRAARIVAEIAGVERDVALAHLDASGGSVKVAVLMARDGLDRAAAEARLRRMRGRLE